MGVVRPRTAEPTFSGKPVAEAGYQENNLGFSAQKVGVSEEINEILSYAYDLGGKDFVLTLGAENGTHDLNRCSPVNSNGYRDCGLCQLNRKWHHKFIDSPEFQDWKNQINYCWGVYSDAMNRGKIKTTFYGYNKRSKVEHLYLFN